ncbi:LacI family DNA-binding transcriptional regulator [Kribbella sp. GL6]|uniref:LacI family DNA-binding transcriptional regulator n=1 Tax=Kribbella sp. GL6 TaxID=3419765 RepID=UPI003D0640F6
MPTIYEVAAEAKVSASIVSRILNGRPVRVTEETRTRVLAVVEQLHYVPSTVARTLRTQRSDTWTLLIPNLADPVLADIARGVTDAAQASGHRVLISTSGNDPRRERAILDTTEVDHAAGLVIVPSTTQLDLSTLTIPVVSVLHPIQSAVDQVLDDPAGTAQRATASLLAAGHRRIACLLSDAPSATKDPPAADNVSGPSGVPRPPAPPSTTTQQYAGYLQAFVDAGLGPPPAYLVRQSPPEPSAARGATHDLLDVEPVDAILLATVQHAIGAVEAMRARGQDPARGPTLFACDWAPWVSTLMPFLSVAKHPSYQLGRTAGSYLLERALAPAQPARSTVLESTLELSGPLTDD